MPYYALDENGKFEGFDIPASGTYCEGEDCDEEKFGCSSCLAGRVAYESGATERFIRYGDLMKIDTPFGLLPKNIQAALQAADKNGAMIQILVAGAEWQETFQPSFTRDMTYRVSPDWKPEEKKEETADGKLIGAKPREFKCAVCSAIFYNGYSTYYENKHYDMCVHCHAPLRDLQKKHLAEIKLVQDKILRKDGKSEEKKEKLLNVCDMQGITLPSLPPKTPENFISFTTPGAQEKEKIVAEIESLDDLLDAVREIKELTEEILEGKAQ